MRKWGVGSVVRALALVLIVAMLMFFVGHDDQRTSPSAESVFPSGLAGFAELLRKDGFTVVIDRDEKPSLKPTDLALAATVTGRGIFQDAEEVSSKTIDRLEEHLAHRGRVLELRVPSDFVTASQQAKSLTASSTNVAVPDVELMLGPESDTGLDIATDEPKLTEWQAPGHKIVEVCPSGSGVITIVRNAVGCTNRFLGVADDAKFYLGLVRQLTPAGGRVVFVEATVGNAESKGLLSVLGSWADAARWQLVLLVAVVAFSLSRRFGAPVDETLQQRTTRDVIDAVATVFRRGKKLDFCAEIIADKTLDTMRVELGLPLGTSRDKILAKASAEFADAYSIVVDPAEERKHQSEAVRDVVAMLDAAKARPVGHDAQ